MVVALVVWGFAPMVFVCLRWFALPRTTSPTGKWGHATTVGLASPFPHLNLKGCILQSNCQQPLQVTTLLGLRINQAQYLMC